MKLKIVKFFLGILPLTICLVFNGCRKDEAPQNVYIWTSENSDSLQLTLFIDGVNKGSLPYLNKKILQDSTTDCNDTLISNQALFFVLENGRYDLEAKDESGNVKISGYNKFTKNSLAGGSSGSGGGGISASKMDACILIELYQK